jgi:hypothetical protein
VAHRQRSHTRIRKRGHNTNACARRKKGAREHSTPQHAAAVPFQSTLSSPRASSTLSLAVLLRSAGRTTPPPQHTQRHGQPNAAGPHTRKRHAKQVRTYGGASPTNTHTHSQAGAHQEQMHLYTKNVQKGTQEHLTPIFSWPCTYVLPVVQHRPRNTHSSATISQTPRSHRHTQMTRQARQGTRRASHKHLTQTQARAHNKHIRTPGKKAHASTRRPNAPPQHPFSSPCAPLAHHPLFPWHCTHLLAVVQHRNPKTRSATASQTPGGAHTQREGTPDTSGHTVAHRQPTHTHSQAGAHHTRMRTPQKGAREHSTPQYATAGPFQPPPPPNPPVLPSRTIPFFRGPALTFYRSYNTTPQHTQRHGQPHAAWPHTRKRHARNVRSHGGASPTHTHAHSQAGTHHTCMHTPQEGNREHSTPQHAVNAALSALPLPFHLSVALDLTYVLPVVHHRPATHAAPRPEKRRVITHTHTQKRHTRYVRTHGGASPKQTHTHSQAGAHYSHMRFHAKRHARALGAPTRCKRCPFSPHPHPTRPSFLGPALTFCRAYNTAPQHTQQRHDQPNAAGPHIRTHTKPTRHVRAHGGASPTHTNAFASGSTLRTHALARKRARASTRRPNTLQTLPFQFPPPTYPSIFPWPCTYVLPVVQHRPATHAAPRPAKRRGPTHTQRHARHVRTHIANTHTYPQG